MKKNLLVRIIFGVLVMTGGILLTGCTSPVEKPAATQPAEKIEIYAPASTSSIPVLLAARQSDLFHVTLYTNQSQANTLFIRGEIPLFVTGLSVGQDLYKQDVPIQLLNSFVSGLSFLVTTDPEIQNFADLKGMEVTVPFEGSPIEDVSAYFAAQQGLVWKEDIQPLYAPFDSSVALLKEGKAKAVVLPEPFVSLLEGQENIQISISFYDEWNRLHPEDQGYPQVGTFVNPDWAAEHASEIEQFNQALAEGIRFAKANPAEAVAQVGESYSFPAQILENSLNRLQYQLMTGTEMKTRIEQYDAILGKPQHEIDAAFYYLSEK